MTNKIGRHAKALAESKHVATNNANHDAFETFASMASGWLGSKWAFAGVILIIIVWDGVACHWLTSVGD